MRVDRFFVCEVRTANLTAQAETQGCGCLSTLMIGQLISVGQSKRMNFHANKNIVQTFLNPAGQNHDARVMRHCFSLITSKSKFLSKFEKPLNS